MKRRELSLRLAAGCALLALLAANVVMAQVKVDQWKKRQQLSKQSSFSLATPSLFLGLPAQEMPAIEVPRTTYSDMLSKGYARIGEYWYSSEKFGWDEARAKKNMLEWAAVEGGDTAWLSTYTESGVKSDLVKGGTYSYYNSGSGSYMHNGSVSTTTTYTTQDRVRSKKVKQISGYAVIFLHNPVLATKQLDEGRRKWLERVVNIPGIRATMIAKLDIVLRELSSLDAALFASPRSKEYLVGGIRSFGKDLYSSGCGYRKFPPPQERYELQYYWERNKDGESKCSESFHVFFELEEFSRGRSDWIFRNPLGPELSELKRAVLDAVRYYDKNWVVIGDFVSPDLQDHILF